MQVKKFEARTMKEALALVKAELGPDAIILSAKDMSSSHGLVGEKSVQVTAAVSEKMLNKKRVAEKELNQDFLQRFQGAPAKKQKEFIDQFFENMSKKKNENLRQEKEEAYRAIEQKALYNKRAETRRSSSLSANSVARRVTATPYVDIVDHEGGSTRPRARAIPKAKTPSRRRKNIEHGTVSGLEEQREKRRAQTTPAPQPVVVEKSKPSGVQQQKTVAENQEVLGLKKQIEQLKSLVENFQSVPQNFLSMHPGAKQGLPYELSGMYNKLLKIGFLEEHIVNILKQAHEKLSSVQIANPALLDAWVAQYLMQNIHVATDPLERKYHAFVGGSGQGKTSVLIKLAAHLSLEKKKSVAIVTADNDKVGAAEQLRIYSQILNIPFTIIQSGQDWGGLEADLSAIDFVLIDTPSCNINDHDSIVELKNYIPSIKGDLSIHYVQSLLARVEDVFDRAQTYLGIGFDDVIFSHVDESSQYGLIYNFQKRFEVPVHSLSTGPKIPEDYEFATREKFVDLIFKLSSHKK